MISRSVQQLGGAIIALASGWVSLWMWHGPLTNHPLYLKGAVLFPAFTVIGLALIICPGYREERIARGEDVSALRGCRLITARWWAILVLALIVGIGNLTLLLSSQH